MEQPRTICSRCVLPDTFPGISFDADGVCSVCRQHEERWGTWATGLPQRREILDRLCQDARHKRKAFDALVPLSGGKDSTYVLLLAVKELGLRCLAATYNNGYLSEHARANIERACRTLGVEHVYYHVNPELMNRLFALFMRKTGYFCSICMRCIEMVTSLAADLYDIPLVLNGSSGRTELPLSAEMFQSGPAAYVRNVLRGEAIATECSHLLHSGSVKRRLGYRLFWWGSQRRIRLRAAINLADYLDWNYDEIYRRIREELGWHAPPDRPEHADCTIHPVSTYLHNRRFPGLEVRRLTLARLIMAGQISRPEALRKLAEEPEPPCPATAINMLLQNLKMTREEFDHYIDMGPRHLLFRPSPGIAWQMARSVKRAIWSTLGIRK
jgi:hypothetical protein